MDASVERAYANVGRLHRELTNPLYTETRDIYLSGVMGDGEAEMFLNAQSKLEAEFATGIVALRDAARTAGYTDVAGACDAYAADQSAINWRILIGIMTSRV